MATMESIEFQIKGDATTATKALDSLAESLKKLKSATGGGLGLSAIANEIKTLKDAASNIGDLKELVSALKDIGKVRISSSFSKSLSEMATALGSLDAEKLKEFSTVMNGMSGVKVSAASMTNFATGLMTISGVAENLSPQSMENLERFVGSLAKLEGVDLSGLGSAMRAVSSGGGKTQTPISQELQDIISNGSQLDLLKIKLQSLQSALQGAFAKGDLKGALSIRNQIDSVKNAIQKLEEEAGKAPSFLSKLGSALKTVFGGIAKGTGSAIKGLGKGFMGLMSYPFQKAATGVKSFAAGIKGITSGLGRIAMYRAFRFIIKQITQAFQEGVKHAYEWSKAMGGPVSSAGMTFAESMNDIATSMRYFKNGIGAAVAPLISALAPAIRVVTDAAVQCLNVINQLIALLTGASGWTKAIRHAEEYGDAVGGAGGAAKKALEYLAPFDELNVLPDPKSGGGGGGGADYSGEFQEMESFADGIQEFATKIKEAFNNSDWQGLGTLLGDKVNELVERIPWGELGTTVGNYIGGFFSTKYWAFKTTDFQEIGAKLAEFFNNALDSINFSDIGGYLAQKLTFAYEIGIGAINNVDFGSVGSSIGDFFRGFFDDLSSTISGVDWGELAENIVFGLANAIKGLDIGELLKSVLNLVGTVAGAVMDAVGTLLIDLAEVIVNPDTWKLVGAWFKDLPAKLKQIGINAINSLIKPAVDAINKLIDKWNETFHTNKPHIEFELIPSLSDEELNRYYNEAKRQLEAKSKKKPIDFKGRVDGMETVSLTVEDRTVDLIGNIGSVTNSLGLVPVRATANLTSVSDKIPTDKKSINVNGNITTKTDSLKDRNINVNGDVKTLNDGLTAQQKILEIKGNITSRVDSLTADDKTLNVKGKFNTKEDALTADQKTFSTKAKFDEYKNNLGTPSISSKANLNSYVVASGVNDGNGNLKVSTKVNIVGQTNTPTIKGKLQVTAVTQAKGGSFYNDAWHGIPQYASGGRPHGSLFVAGEAGAEVVGHVGGRTEVLNRSQIASAIYSAVKSAMVGTKISMSTPENSYDDGTNEDIMYRAFSRALNEAENVIELDGDVVYRKMVQRNRQNTRATGLNAMA